MTVEEIKKEIERMQEMAKGIKLETGLLRADINKLEGCIKQDDEAADEAYQRGCKDAWDMAKRIELDPKDYKDSIPIEKLNEVFGTPFAYRVFLKFDYQEVVSILNATVECKDEICVGDIVRYKKDDHLDLYVLKVYDDKTSFKGLVISDSRGYSCGDTISLCFIDDYVKTGRHHDFGKILEFLKS